MSTVQNPDGSTDTTYSDGSVTHVDANGNATTSPPGTVPAGSVPPGAPAGTPPVGTPGAAASGPLPTITALSSTSVQQGDIITVTGANLTGVTAVDIGGMQADFSIDSPTQLSVMVPMSALSGTLHLTPGTATAMIQVAQPMVQSDPYGGGGGFGGGGGGDSGYGDSGYGDSGYGDSGYGDSGYGGDSGDSGAQPQYADDSSMPDGDDGGGDSDEMAAAADEAIDELLSQSDDGDDLDEDDYDDDDAGGLDDMSIDLVGVEKGAYWDNSKDYWTGDIVWYLGKFWRAVRPISSPTIPLFQSGEVPGTSDAWVEERNATLGAVVGGFDVGKEQLKMNALKVVPVSIARVLLDSGQKAIDHANMLATLRNLPNQTPRDTVVGKLRWHRDALDKLTDPNAIYASGDDLKHWVMQAFVEANASEEGAGTTDDMTIAQMWADMWTLVAKEIAKLPGALRSGLAKVIEGVTGIPIWLWIAGGVLFVGVVGFGIWKVAMVAAPVAVKRYLP